MNIEISIETLATIIALCLGLWTGLLANADAQPRKIGVIRAMAAGRAARLKKESSRPRT
jgi:hypothetical protein